MSAAGNACIAERGPKRLLPMATLPILAMLPGFQGAQAIESMHLSEVDALPVAYRIVKSCGAWQAGERRGNYRVVVADVSDGAGSELYVQWIAQPTQLKRAERVETVAIAELNNDHAQYDIRRVDCRRERGGTVIEVKAYFEHDENDRVHAFRIHLPELGRYRLTEQVGKARRGGERSQ